MGEADETAAVTVETPYGIIRFDAKIWLKTEFRDGQLVFCDASIKTDGIPIGAQLTSP